MSPQPPLSRREDASSRNGHVPARPAAGGAEPAPPPRDRTLASELALDPLSFPGPESQLLKFCGPFPVKIRDAAPRRHGRPGRELIVRCRVPSGGLAAGEYLALDEVAGTHGRGRLRLTRRHTIEIWGAVHHDVSATLAVIADSLPPVGSDPAAYRRYSQVCPTPATDNVLRHLQDAAALLDGVLGRGRAVGHEIWLDGCRVEGPRPSGQGFEPPGHFRAGLALPEDNCIDLCAHDVGLLAIVEGGQVGGYDLWAGGAPPASRPGPVCFVPASGLAQVAEALARLAREPGLRRIGRRAAVADGCFRERLLDLLAHHLGGAVLAPSGVAVGACRPHVGWHPQGDGKYYYGLPVDHGRVEDRDRTRLRSALRAVAERLQPRLRLTPTPGVLFVDLDADARPEVEAALAEFGVPRPRTFPLARKPARLFALPAGPKPPSAPAAPPFGSPGPRKLVETFWVGPPGRERRDYTVRYAGDGSVRETVVYFYGADCRAAAARPGDALCRKAIHTLPADTTRPEAARKLRDVYYIGPPGQERRDRVVHYRPDGRPARTTVFYYEGDRRAGDLAARTALRRQAVFQGASD